MLSDTAQHESLFFHKTNEFLEFFFSEFSKVYLLPSIDINVCYVTDK